jgi:hypothetical protein
MSLLHIAGDGLRTLAAAVERLDSGSGHGLWCDASKAWEVPTSGGRIIPIRISDEVIKDMLSENGWEYTSKSVHLTQVGDGTSSLIFQQAEEVDHLSNRVVQRMVGSALDLAETLDSSNCDLSEEAIEALAEFKRAARQRLRISSHDDS